MGVVLLLSTIVCVIICGSVGSKGSLVSAISVVPKMSIVVGILVEDSVVSVDPLVSMVLDVEDNS